MDRMTWHDVQAVLGCFQNIHSGCRNHCTGPKLGFYLSYRPLDRNDEISLMVQKEKKLSADSDDENQPTRSQVHLSGRLAAKVTRGLKSSIFHRRRFVFGCINADFGNPTLDV